MKTDTRPQTLRRLPGGALWRQPWAGEAAWFHANPDVAGFAADDGSVVLNPYLRLSPRQLRSVLLNEATRIVLRCRRRASPAFFLNLWQRARFADYGTEIDRGHTVVARLVARDPSAGVPTAAQSRLVRRIRRSMNLDEPGEQWRLLLAALVRRPRADLSSPRADQILRSAVRRAKPSIP